MHTLEAQHFYNCLCWENNAEQIVEYKFEKIVSVVKIVKILIQIIKVWIKLWRCRDNNSGITFICVGLGHHSTDYQPFLLAMALLLDLSLVNIIIKIWMIH